MGNDQSTIFGIRASPNKNGQMIPIQFYFLTNNHLPHKTHTTRTTSVCGSSSTQIVISFEAKGAVRKELPQIQKEATWLKAHVTCSALWFECVVICVSGRKQT
jgi:hypothetical protein